MNGKNMGIVETNDVLQYWARSAMLCLTENYLCSIVLDAPQGGSFIPNTTV